MLLSFITTILLFFQPSDNWSINDYEEYDFQKFFSRQDVKQHIDPENFDKELLNAAVFYATNEVRNSKKKKTFTFNPILQKAAVMHSEDMLQFHFLSHINTKEKDKKTPMMRIDKAGGDFNSTAENIAKVGLLDLGPGENYYINEQGEKTDDQGNPLQYHTYSSLARKVVDGWMHSKDHRKNILSDYSFLGCGVADISFSRDELPELLITQNFGKK